MGVCDMKQRFKYTVWFTAEDESEAEKLIQDLDDYVNSLFEFESAGEETGGPILVCPNCESENVDEIVGEYQCTRCYTKWAK